jgi:hypothetical protein
MTISCFMTHSLVDGSRIHENWEVLNGTISISLQVQLLSSAQNDRRLKYRLLLQDKKNGESGVSPKHTVAYSIPSVSRELLSSTDAPDHFSVPSYNVRDTDAARTRRCWRRLRHSRTPQGIRRHIRGQLNTLNGIVWGRVIRRRRMTP